MKIATVEYHYDPHDSNDDYYSVVIGGVYLDDGWGTRADAQKKADKWDAALIPLFLRFGSLVREEAAKTCKKVGDGYDNDWNKRIGMRDATVEACEECEEAVGTISLPALLEKMEEKP